MIIINIRKWYQDNVNVRLDHIGLKAFLIRFSVKVEGGFRKTNYYYFCQNQLNVTTYNKFNVTTYNCNIKSWIEN